MTAFLIRRLLAMVPVLALVLVIVFSLVRFIPGDPAVTLLGPGATQQQIQALRLQLDLDKTLPLQFLSYLAGLAQGDLGQSLKSGLPVARELLSRLPATLELAFVALIGAVLVGIPLGVVSATRPNTLLDHALRVGSLVGVSVPAFLLALVLQLVFSVWLGWLPVSGRTSPFASGAGPTGFALVDSLAAGNLAAFFDGLAHVLLPATVLAAFLAATLARFVRNALMETLGEDFIRTARAKGLTRAEVVYGHGLRNALLPAITVVGLKFAEMLGGAVLTETIFAWPGIGRYMFEAIRNRDYPVIQGTTLLFALIFVASSIVVDVLHALLDPRIRRKVAS
jgi:ABC-type dipeptide/oligopeptide/nickel transport system permease component